MGPPFESGMLVKKSMFAVKFSPLSFEAWRPKGENFGDTSKDKTTW